MDKNISLEELAERLQEEGVSDSYEINPILINADNLDGIEFDKKSFEKGLKNVSELCGMLTGLMNVGLNAELALTYIMNKENLDSNIKMTDKNNETTLKVADKQRLMMDKMEV